MARAVCSQRNSVLSDYCNRLQRPYQNAIIQYDHCTKLIHFFSRLLTRYISTLILAFTITQYKTDTHLHLCPSYSARLCPKRHHECRVPSRPLIACPHSCTSQVQFRSHPRLLAHPRRCCKSCRCLPRNVRALAGALQEAVCAGMYSLQREQAGKNFRRTSVNEPLEKGGTSWHTSLAGVCLDDKSVDKELSSLSTVRNVL